MKLRRFLVQAITKMSSSRWFCHADLGVRRLKHSNRHRAEAGGSHPSPAGLGTPQVREASGMSHTANTEIWCPELGPRLPIDKTCKYKDLKASARVSQCHQRHQNCLSQGDACPEPLTGALPSSSCPPGVKKERHVFWFGFSQHYKSPCFLLWLSLGSSRPFPVVFQHGSFPAHFAERRALGASPSSCVLRCPLGQAARLQLRHQMPPDPSVCVLLKLVQVPAERHSDKHEAGGAPGAVLQGRSRRLCSPRTRRARPRLLHPRKVTTNLAQLREVKRVRGVGFQSEKAAEPNRHT